MTRHDTRQRYPAQAPVALRLSVASTRSVSLWDPCASWREGSGIGEKRRALVLLPRAHVEAQDIPKKSPVGDEEDTAEGQSGTLPAGTAIPHSDHSCPHLRSHTLPWFSHTWLDKRIGRVYNQKWPCHQSGVNVCLYLTSLSWFGHLGSLGKPSWKKPPFSCWHNSSPSLGFICKFPLCRTKLNNDICCLWGQSWTRSIKTNFAEHGLGKLFWSVLEDFIFCSLKVFMAIEYSAIFDPQ